MKLLAFPPLCKEDIQQLVQRLYIVHRKLPFVWDLPVHQ